jgi:HPt (histidine-containing phosphotransfer) domain-containing protein
MDNSDRHASCINWNATLEATGQDPVLLDDLVKIFLEEAPTLIKQIQQGLENSDSSIVRRASHTLKGSLRIFEATGGVELAFQIERLGQEGELSKVPALLDDLEAYMAKVMAELRTHLNR